MRSKNILVVDDVLDWQNTLSNLLTTSGYQVYTAGNQAEAIQIVQQQAIHLAILDMRLDETDEENREGLDLVSNIKMLDSNIVIIILTGYYGPEVFQAIRNRDQGGIAPVYDLIDKIDTEFLLTRVDEAFATRIKINWGLVIENFIKYHKLLRQKIRFSQSKKLPSALLIHEVDELFSKFFLDCDRVRIKEIHQGFGGGVVFTITPIYKGKGPGTDLIIKIGEHSLIQKEISRYNRWVENVVGGNRFPRLLKVQQTRSLGGIIYNFAG